MGLMSTRPTKVIVNLEMVLKRLMCLNSPTLEPSIEATNWKVSRLSVRGLFAYLKESPWGAGIFFNTHLEACWNALWDGSWRAPSLCSLSALFQLSSIFQKGNCTLLWCLNLYGCCPGTYLDHQVLVASGPHAHKSYGTVTSGKRVSNQLPLPEHSKRQESKCSSHSSCERGLLAYLHDCWWGQVFTYN